MNDGVMGGRSAGFVKVESGALQFTGTLVTQGGGFTLGRVRSIGLYMADGRDGEIRLEVDYIRSYGARE